MIYYIHLQNISITLFNLFITSVDTTPPTVTCINDIVQVVELGTSGTQVFFTEPSATDISGQVSLLSRTNSPGDTYPVGVTTVTYVFVDNAGNTADPCTFTITVNTSKFLYLFPQGSEICFSLSTLCLVACPTGNNYDEYL